MNNFGKQQSITEAISGFLGILAKRPPDDVIRRLRELREKEESQLGRVLYDAMFENMERAQKLNRPTCQDTGLLQFFLRAGAGFPYLAQLEASIIDAVRIATDTVPLRHNVVETFDEINTGTNIGTRAPWIEWEIVQGSSVEMDIYMAGGGCSLPGNAKVLMPASGYEGVVEMVFDTVIGRGLNACPPLIVGVGIGTCMASAAKLSKKALLRPLGTMNPHPKAAQMEKSLFEGLNRLGIGPQGLLGTASVMGVNIETAARHPATLGVGVSVGCWANRRGTIRFDKDLNVEILSHKGAAL